MVKIIVKFLYMIVFYIFRIFPVKKNKIVVACFNGKGYADSPKYIIDKLLNEDFDIVWSVSKNYEDIPKNIKQVKYQSIKWIYHMVTAKVWLNNCRFPYYVRKREKQYYVQTWHGCLGLKKVELDAKDALPKSYMKGAMRDSKMADLFLSGSDWTNELYRRAFNYHGEILDSGTPRNDILFDLQYHKKIKDKVYKHFNIDKNKLIILYAPTFRSDMRVDCYNIDFNVLGKELNKKYSKDCIFLIKLHPNVTDKASSLKYNNKVLNATSYPDIQELMITADILITDYSSTMFEFGLMKKPCFLYASDIQEFMKDRNFYFDIKKLPFNLTTSNDELIKTINQFNLDKYLKELDNFFKDLGLKETGKSAQATADIIIKRLTKG